MPHSCVPRPGDPVGRGRDRPEEARRSQSRLDQTRLSPDRLSPDRLSPDLHPSQAYLNAVVDQGAVP
jgi:hypothetical protein